MQHSLVSDTSQVPVEPEKQDELILEEAGPAEVGFITHEEQPGTLDPSNLTLSIENDMEMNPLLSTDYPSYPAFGVEEEDEIETTKDLRRNQSMIDAGVRNDSYLVIIMEDDDGEDLE